jgi:uncharacterized membrane protein
MLVILIASFALGIVSGLRSLVSPAAVLLTRGGIVGYILALAALGELYTDMQPNTPARTSPPALIARIASGAFVGWMLGTLYGGAPPIAGAVAGVAGALVGTYGGLAARLSLSARIGARPAALTEDAVAIVAAAAVLFAVASR